ncbi:M20/M25/M40 family metallo-hydrolase [Microbacterium sp. HD4P20]|uniref:M20/M25/M40 family metallo-hydrolase n=1 Tax=Microbacterium sp. HD4P20 TaxID=2864874 RepID=UPI001C6421EC|nr:M20/M25/M40 family metallo-hydrolase [Microbacterium sp. HD4P20]MCP2637412.1 M20/M25/M40 family metallo-hydrolase [Microbacterium sp. HD4P20]
MPIRNRRTLAIATAAALGASVVLATPAYAGPNNNSVDKITKAVTLDGVMQHLEAFQAISDEHGDRASGRPGYAASVDYVVEQLEAAGYTPEVQEFEFEYFDENNALIRVSPNPRTFVDGDDFVRNEFDTGSPEGTATAPLVPVDLPSPDNTGGCTAADFAGFPAGSIALIQRGGCGFAVKAVNAQAAGAAGVIIMNSTGDDSLVGMIGDATGLTIPAVFATYSAGADLASTPGATVTVTVDYDADIRTTYNVFAETTAGDDSNTVMAGAHLDSVQDGAGINDNGTGSAGLLETAIQMKKVKPNNTVRFAWWGAEESGLLGSEHYVANLSEEQIADLALYLNFDMIGSPNYIFGVYDGDNSGGTAEEGFIPEGSAQIEDVFEQFYTDRGEPFQDSEFSGRSDYGPFIAVGVPAGGLFTGAEVQKTVAEAALYGGVAGASYDPCYHSPCDNLTGEGQDEALYAQLAEDYDLVGNVNTHALDVNADAVAAAVLTFAFDTSTVNGVSAPGKSHGNANANAMKNRFAE